MTSRSVTSVDVQFHGGETDGRTAPVITGTVDLPGDARELSPEEFRASGVPVAVFVHCFTCNRKVPAAFRVSKALARAGIACLRFDFPGLGDSQGDFAETTFSSNVADLRAAAAWLEERLAAPSLLAGHSLGGAVALRAARHITSLDAVATIGAPFRPASAARSLQASCADIRPGEVRTVHLAERDIPISHSFLSDLAVVSEPDGIADDIAAVRTPLLVLHSPTDQTVPVSEATRIFEAAHWPKNIISLDDADHLLTWRGSAQRAGQMIATWAERYIRHP
ncbi:alpha/beta hydrolase family protein [Corynebacterium glyciniphilum]|uniref:alpha/beta hydrolase family protein n=1 Tax=Corynebacterium glyciniphilum TaxID=1404244 RepID=UPI0021B3E491|nr:alpha/beta hydrolase [Corynebacterium glyciniphilum]